ncbi:ASST-domain-containing protein [Lentinula detonsa]|uniref:ASST-domain-containing protein n=1 Tax=Lentinula detonsa TaxID=2804962 RepID=A0AA38Q2G0_9AGAR|nr:ASST-domain-containing protein [Lentinula detonsa]
MIFYSSPPIHESLGLLTLLSCLVQLARSDSVFIASSDYAAGAYGSGPFQSFFSVNSTPSVWNFARPLNRTDVTLSSGYLFTAPRGSDTLSPGPLIYDNDGSLVWDGTNFGETLVFQVETYLGEPHILTWAGDSLASGVGSGYVSLINNQYELVARFTTNLTGITGPTYADFHEVMFLQSRITTKNTALMTAYQTKQMDLSSYGGPSNGYISDSVFQEINVTTGAALFTWHAIEHVDPSECYNELGSGGTSTSNAWDYFHINSIDVSEDGNFLISSRHCFTIYYINATNGDIIWQMGGAKSDFTMGDGASYSWQHHARWITKNDTYATLTVFDNAGEYGESDESNSRGLHLALNFTSMSVELIQDFIPYNTTLSQSQGSVQLQPNGNFLVGWGFMPWASEYSPSGELLWAAQFGVVGGNYNEGYRALRFNWTGEPTAPPSMSFIHTSKNNITSVYASWNGDTRTERWELIGATDSSGSGAASLYNKTRSGFETTITVNTAAHRYSYFAVRALGSGNVPLGISEFTNNGNGVAVLVNGFWRKVLVTVAIIYTVYTT